MSTLYTRHYVYTALDALKQHGIPSSSNWNYNGSDDDDWSEITVLQRLIPSGEILPPQVILGGKTLRCHSNVNTSQNWNVIH